MVLFVRQNRPPNIRCAVDNDFVVVDRPVDQIVEKFALCSKIGIRLGEPYWMNCDGVALLVEGEHVVDLAP